MKKEFLFLLFLIFLASIFRFWGLDRVPPGLFGDEVDVGYHAYSLLKTGKDYLGQPWPVYLHSLAEWRAPLFIYSVIPSVAVFGLNEWGVRVPAAFWGVLDVVVVFFLVKELFAETKLAFLTGLFLAISPWHLQYSRAAFEVTLLLFLFLAGALFFIKGLKKPIFFIFSAIFFALAPYTYSTGSLFLFLIAIALVFIYRREIFKIGLSNKFVLFSLLLFFVMLFPICRKILSGEAVARFNYLSVFQDQKLIEQINLARVESLSDSKQINQVSWIEKLNHNRPLIWLKTIGNNYLEAFSTEFLFVKGDPNQRQSVGIMGEMYWVDLIFLIAGFWYLLKRKDQAGFLVLIWLFLAPIASSLTRDGGNHATRLILMLPALMIISACGVVFLLSTFWGRKYILPILSLFLIFNFCFYQHYYWIHYPLNSWLWWDIGYKEPMKYIKNHEKDYQIVVINDTFNHSLLHFLFWTAYPPEKFRQEFKGDTFQKDILPGIDGYRLGKYYFGSMSQETKAKMAFVKVIKPGMLFFASQRNDIGGNWDWRTDRPNEIKLIMAETDPKGFPLYYLITHQ